VAQLQAALIGGCGGGSDSSTNGTGVAQQQPPPGSRKVTVEKIGEFDQPTYIAQAPGTDDFYVVERAGRLRIVRAGEALDEPALDIRDQVVAEGEQGLLSVAFPPDFQNTRLLYVYFTGNDQDQHVVEYAAPEDGTVDPDSARELLHMDDFASNHNGGSCCSGRTASSTLARATGDSPATPSATARTSARCSARCCG